MGACSAAAGGDGSIAAGDGGRVSAAAGCGGLVVVGQRGFFWRGEDERSFRMNVILFPVRALIIKKKAVRSSAAIYIYVTESMIKKDFFHLFLFSSKFTREST